MSEPIYQPPPFEPVHAALTDPGTWAAAGLPRPVLVPCRSGGDIWGDRDGSILTLLALPAGVTLSRLCTATPALLGVLAPRIGVRRVLAGPPGVFARPGAGALLRLIWRPGPPAAAARITATRPLCRLDRRRVLPQPAPVGPVSSPPIPAAPTGAVPAVPR